MGDLVHSAGNAVERTEAARYSVVVAGLAEAGKALAGLSEQVAAAFQYVEGCASSVDRLADQMAGLQVDHLTVTEHRDAAAAMRSVLEHAEAMAVETASLAMQFQWVADTHQAEYGNVAAAASALTVPMADAQFYTNR